MRKLKFGRYELDTQKNVLLFHGDPLDLEPQVYCLLELLICRHGELVSRDDIIAEVWDGRIVSNSVIDNRIRAARAAIGDNGRSQDFIKTYPNRGYKFIAEVQISDGSSAPRENVTLENRDQSQPTRNARLSSYTPIRSFAAVASILVALFLITQTVYNHEDASASDMVAELDPDAIVVDGDPNALPRIAVLPFETIGNNSRYEFLPQILERELNQTITAVRGLTVASFAPGTDLSGELRSYKTLQEDFQLDYAVASTLSSYGEYSKLHVSLIRISDSSILCSETYDLQFSDEDGWRDIPARIAIKATIAVANKLNLSVNELTPSLSDYHVQTKIERADEMMYSGDYEDIVAGIVLLREAVAEEPNYLLAKSKLFWALGWEFPFTAENYEASIREMAELALEMERLSPEAPETLLTKAFMLSMTDGGTSKSSVGDTDEGQPIAIIKSVLAKDPDNIDAHELLATTADFERDQSLTVEAYRNALSYNPTEPWLLGAYSWALYCNQDVAEARVAINQTIKWHPDHRDVLTAQAQIAHGIGDYPTALTAISKLIDRGMLTHYDTKVVRALFFDLGRADLALPHVRFGPARSHVFAMMGENEAAIKASMEIENFYTSVMARMIARQDYYPPNYSVDRTYFGVGKPGDETEANFCRLHHLTRDAYVLQKIGSTRAAAFVALLEDFYSERDINTFISGQEFSTLMGYYVLKGQPDDALRVMDAAMERGFVFVDSFREPYLRDLTDHPEFPQRFQTMTQMAQLMIDEFWNTERNG